MARVVHVVRAGFVAVLSMLLVAASALTGHAATDNAAKKTVRTAFLIAETTFDPHVASDLYSNTIMDAIFDPLLKYDYLARPVKLIGNTAIGLPEVSADGRIYTFRVKAGIFFAEDAAFGGKPREVTAYDYAYSLKRLFDPAIRSPWLWYVEGKIVGGDEALQAAKKSGKFEYDGLIDGISTPDKNTLRVRIKEADSNFIYIFATVQTAALAREVIEKYRPDPGAHPVGSGPFKLVEWKRSHKIVLEKNPQFRSVIFQSSPTVDVNTDPIAANLNGKRLPLVDRVEVTIVEESQPRWLAFLGGETDYANVPSDFINSAFPGGKLAPNLIKQGIRGDRFIETDLVFMYFNLDDPLMGGKTPFAPEKVALRRAIALGYNIDEEINVIRNGGAARARSGIPPGVEGYDPNFQTDVNEYDPPRARALLDMFGYKDVDGDGFRETPDGKPMTIEIASEPDQLTKQFNQLWQKNMNAIGIRVKFKIAKWPDLNKDAKASKNMMWQLAWSADYPDAENFLQNLYGPNAGQSNYSNFRHPQFDKLYDEARRMPASPERNKRYAEMNRIAAVYMPWIPQTHRYRNEVWQPWLVGYRKHPIYNQAWLYLDIDESKRPAK